jgi:hypothetical protein
MDNFDFVAKKTQLNQEDKENSLTSWNKENF